MTSGKEHDQATKRWTIAFALCIGLISDVKSGVIGGAAFLIGGLFLSPDLDTNSIALKRWGIFKCLWYPYQKLISHRSILSHGPFLGTAIRISYLLLMISLIFWSIKELGFLHTLDIKSSIIEQFQKHPKKVSIILLSLEASAWLHLIKDNYFIPKKLRRTKKYEKI